MTFIQIILILICVIAISFGQILFKKVGLEVQVVGGWLDWKIFIMTVLAFTVYGSATILWISILRTVDLTKAYIFMSLSFIIVPILSNIIFGERLSQSFLAGMVLIVTGIFVIVKYG
jgi:drug/metabolite transporter (DMT)-like permease